MMRSRSCLCLSFFWSLAVVGCNSFDGPAEERGPRLVVPVDQREAIQSDVAPLPVSGGTLLATSQNRSALVSDPERDTVSVVDLTTLTVRTLALQPGDQPGRAVEDTVGNVHVALRGGGAIVSIDVVEGSILQRRAVCKAPRGIAFDGTSGLLHVACAEGKLVSLAADGGDVVRTIPLPPDLRDVMVRGSEIWVTRFKSAQVLRIDAQGTVLQTVQLPERPSTLTRPVEGDENVGAFVEQPVTLQPDVAWRSVPMSNGGALIVHEDAVKDEIEITEPSPSGGSAYGGNGFGCGGIVRDAVSVVGSDGTVTSRRGFAGAPLPVDVAVSPDGLQIAVAHAGTADPETPRPFVQFPGGESSGGVAPALGVGSVSILPAEGAPDDPCAFPAPIFVNVPVVSVAYTSDGLLLAQTREPPQLLVGDPNSGGFNQAIPLPGDSRLDTGHEIFHRDAGGGIACASCHPEGGEDGHVWQFAGVGQRRTQALHVGLGATAPFHWSGDLNDVGELMTTVFVGRMGGVRESEDRLDVLTTWLFGLERPPAMRDANEEAVVRGEALFHSTEVACSSCHSGDHLTNNRNADVGTAPAPLQVPSLVAIGYRAPFLHDGCAPTLAQRFDPACGGAQHGNTSQLTETEILDLIAYLESL